ncbi:16S rRNA (uracil(1498)-N(3))-methyltransferase [Nakamurella lactea]|uniref:16S rRNA (uracil(1498)-N(3))-methyltransferase n=1 Tax=Nakamurella lactea TaxID=459515 RepID=UPI00041F4074|nr:16S rRNA (uracil(1498)-N(3))-methyltransferase [Nakamurella lactea]
MSGEAWYLVDQAPGVGSFVLDGVEGRHAATVRRTRPGERLVLTDGRGTRCLATVVGDGSAGKGTLDLRVEAVTRVPQPVVTVTVVQALPKGERSDLAVDLLTEAGVDAIVPWQAARCVARWAGPKADRGVQKWRTVAREAGKQSRRPWLPAVGELASTAEVTELIAGFDLALVLHEAQSRPLTDVTLPTSGRVLLVVGPEGGVAPEEIEAFAAAGAIAVRLGHEVLRTSTAGAVALGALGVLTPRWA